jgi:hypothetical protein
MEQMHVANEQKKNEEDQKKAKEMEVSNRYTYQVQDYTLIVLLHKAMHAVTEQKKNEEDQKKAKEMEVRNRYTYQVQNQMLTTSEGYACCS